MSDEPTPEDQSGDNTIKTDAWAMPKPVFRSTEGYTPGSGIEGAITDEMEAGTGAPAKKTAAPAEPGYEMEAAVTEEMPGYKPDAITEEIPGPKAPKKGGCFRSIVLIGLVLVVVAAGAFAAVYFFLPEYLPAGADPFQ